MRHRRIIPLALVITVALAGIGADAAPGDPDPRFGDGGVATIRFPWGAKARATAIDEVGRVLIAGQRAKGGRDLIVARLTKAGKLDRTFGENGKTIFDFGGDEYVERLLVGIDGSITLIGDRSGAFGPSAIGGAPRGLGHHVVARLTRDGVPDEAFGDGGKIVIKQTPADDQLSDGCDALLVCSEVTSIEGAVLLHDGSLVLRLLRGGEVGVLGAGVGAARSFLLRIDSAGEADPTFGGGLDPMGYPAGRTVLSVDRAGNLLSAAWAGNGSDRRLIVQRRSPNGVPDASFGVGGTATFDVGELSPSAVEDDGSHYYVLGRVGPTYTPGIVRLDLTGSVDDSFGEAGVLLLRDVPFGAEAISVHRGAIYLVGDEAQCSRCMARFGLTGDIDPTFGDDGLMELLPGGWFYPDSFDLAGRRGVVVGDGNGALRAARFKL